MAYDHTKVDLSRIPDGALKDTFIHFAEQHNALVEEVNELQLDFEQVAGSTPEEKAETSKILGAGRKAFGYLHSKRFWINLLTLQVGGLLFIAKNIGITMSPEQSRHLIDALIQIVQKFASQ